MKIKALAGWYGGNRTHAPLVGRQLTGCKWVAVLFAGGMSELPHIDARTMLVCDQHRHIINLARVVADPELRPVLVRRLARKILHPDELSYAQSLCREVEAGEYVPPLLDWAEAYFVCCWMSRAGIVGTADEFTGRVSLRYNSRGGDSAVRYVSALRSLGAFSAVARRCTFEVADAFHLAERIEDDPEHGIYADSPFPLAGRRYRHNAGKTPGEERRWHQRLADALGRFEKARVVVRYFDHPLIRELYPEPRWTWHRPEGGRTQANKAAPEVLLVNGPPAGGAA